MVIPALSAYISDFNLLQTLQATLSSSQELRKEFEIALSSIPVHPFEKLKTIYKDEEVSQLSFDELVVDPNFCPKTCAQSICSIAITFDDNVMNHFCVMSSAEVDDAVMECNAFVELSCTPTSQEFVINKKKVSGYLNMLETIKSIPISLIESDPEGTAKKLLTYYVKTMS